MIHFWQFYLLWLLDNHNLSLQLFQVLSTMLNNEIISTTSTSSFVEIYLPKLDTWSAIVTLSDLVILVTYGLAKYTLTIAV